MVASSTMKKAALAIALGLPFIALVHESLAYRNTSIDPDRKSRAMYNIIAAIIMLIAVGMYAILGKGKKMAAYEDQPMNLGDDTSVMGAGM